MVRLLTEAQGLLAGYVRGGQSRMLKPVLLPGNRVRARWFARVAEQLGHLTLELEASRAALLFGSRLDAAALGWITALVGTVLPERIAYPAIHTALAGLLDAIEHAARPADWLPALVKTEALILAELGFGLDFNCCAATGQTDDLAYVSPRSAQAVSRAAGSPYAARLLPLPAFLLDRAAPADDDAIRDGLALTGFFLERSLLTDRAAPLIATRARLMAGLARDASSAA